MNFRVRGPILPDGEVRDLYVDDGTVTYEPIKGAAKLAEGWIVPGLVDAHCHLGLAQTGAQGVEETERDAQLNRDSGTLLIRDAGSPVDTTWIQGRADLPRLIRAGQHIARTRRYKRGYAEEVEPIDLNAEVARQAVAGDGWVKLVGDWISREAGDLLPSFTDEEFAAAIRVAHEHGAKVTAHCFGPDVLPALLDAGINCIEHGTGLTSSLIDQMATQQVALVPTVMQTEKFPDFAEAGANKFPAYSHRMTGLYARRREVVMNAYEAGVAMYVGTDGGGSKRHGNLAGEIAAMCAMGLPTEYVVGAASWKGRDWLGWNPTLSEGAPADFVVFSRDPLADVSVLFEPSLVVLRGLPYPGSQLK